LHPKVIHSSFPKLTGVGRRRPLSPKLAPMILSWWRDRSSVPYRALVRFRLVSQSRKHQSSATAVDWLTGDEFSAQSTF
jgi:hypothetical protein